MWIQKAKTQSHRQLEKSVQKVRPIGSHPERTKYVTEHRLRVELELNESEMIRLRRVQDLVTGTLGRVASLEDTIQQITAFYLHHKDPAEKSKRVIAKKGFRSASAGMEIGMSASNNAGKGEDYMKARPAPGNPEKPVRLETPMAHDEPVALQVGPSDTASAGFARTPLRAEALHAVHFRDERRCAYVNVAGKRCVNTRYLEIHHRRPVHQGGDNSISNLITLCSAHHDYIHSAKK